MRKVIFGRGLIVSSQNGFGIDDVKGIVLVKTTTLFYSFRGLCQIYESYHGQEIRPLTNVSGLES